MNVRRIGLAIASIALLATAGCASAKADKPAASGSTAAASATTAHNMANMDHTAGSHDMANMPGMGTVITGSATGDSPCEKAMAKPASPGEVGNGAGGSAGTTDAEGGHGARGAVKQELLTNAQRVELEAQMRQARTVIDRYPTVKTAEAAGYRMSTVFVPCIGAHYTNFKYIMHFDPANPSELLYDGTKPDSKIIGLSFLNVGVNGPPEGFAGPNDHWHQHNSNGGLCLKGGSVVGGEDTTDAQCTARGGKKAGNIMKYVWMVHAWVAPGWECSWGVFAGECPELGGKLGGTAFDN